MTYQQTIVRMVSFFYLGCNRINMGESFVIGVSSQKELDYQLVYAKDQGWLALYFVA